MNKIKVPITRLLKQLTPLVTEECYIKASGLTAILKTLSSLLHFFFK